MPVSHLSPALPPALTPASTPAAGPALRPVLRAPRRGAAPRLRLVPGSATAHTTGDAAPPVAVPRWWAWTANRRRLRCPAGHHLPYTCRFPEAGAVRCAHWIADEARECGHHVWVVSLRGGGAIVIAVSLDELEALEDSDDALSPTATLTFFGIFDARSLA